MIDLKQYHIEMWDEEKKGRFRVALLEWYDAHKRDLPWRRTKDPYGIWVSEIMLQQTRVDTVIPYYERFLKWFPTIADLASAPEEQLLKAWEGLGYYSRVRNMQQAAIQVMTEFNGQFPTTLEEISTLKGIGPYTAGAIASIAFDIPAPAVDGNVMRVMARLFEVNYDIGVPSNRKIFQQIMEELIDPIRPGDFNQALMDLGSDIESFVNPRPQDSPVKEFSAAYLNGTMDKYPIKAAKKKAQPVYFKAFILQNAKGEFLLERNTQSKLLAGFWSFPLIEDFSPRETQLSLLDKVEETPAFYPNEQLTLEQQFKLIYGIDATWTAEVFPEVQHVFSHRKWHIALQYGKVLKEETIANRQLEWVHPSLFEQYPFAKPQQKMWEMYRMSR